MRYLAGSADKGKGFLNSQADAQKVLDAVHSGEATILGVTKNGHLAIKYTGVTGTNVNLGKGVASQSTNTFLIKWTVSPSVVPTSPTFTP